MNQTHHVLFHILLLYFLFVEVQSQGSSPVPNQGDVVSNFEPSLAVVIGILLVMFSITFFLLIYAKFCHRGDSSSNRDLGLGRSGALTRSRRFSGIDKIVIESLPFFRFSALKGSREGLECAVCLSKFEDVEILRLLPKCKHAFHIECIDHWLERHSTCPLCRHKFSPDDPSIFTYSNSMRVLEESNLEIVIEREEEEEEDDRSSHGSARFGIVGSSFRKIFKSISNNKEEENPSKETDKETTLFHKYNHRIVMSDVVFKNRWSNVSSSDIMFLDTEMLGVVSSDRLSPLEPVPLTIVDKLKSSSSSEMVGSKVVEKPRSQSEITGVSRFVHLKMKAGGDGKGELGDRKEERRRQLWFPIARRTVQWFANRERRSQDSSHNKNNNSNEVQDLDV